VQKARKAFREANSFFKKVESLYRQKARPQVDFDRAKLNRDISKASAEQARVDYKIRKRMLADCTLRADVDGFVVDVLNKTGELVAPGYPVILLRTEQQLINVGVTQRDAKKLTVGTPAAVHVDGVAGRGKVINISQLPDTRSRTYNVEIELTDKLREQDFYIGSIARVSFQIGESDGIWIPIQAVMTDGVTYVYTVEKSRAVRKNLDLGGTSGNFVEVTGIDEGTKVIVEGMKNLKEGYQVAIR
jgi:RND family efflux transporter MFP subunit